MKLFECIISDNEHVFKVFTTAKNKKEMLNVYGGNGDFEKITDVTNEYLTNESIDKLESDLNKMQWGKAERALICALVKEHIKNR